MSRKVVVTSVMTAVAAVGFATYSNAHAANLTLNTVKDCDSNAVVYCGASSLSTLQSRYAHGDGHNSASSIQHIYSYFGISGSDISNMSKYAVAGTVTKSGNVYVGSELVATDAITAGRLNIPGSTKVSFAGTTFYKRAPRVSFVSSPLQAYVVMVNGKFQFAILASCGNPVTAKPKTPNYTIQKEVRLEGKGNNVWQHSVSVKPKTPVQYRITVKSTGDVPAKNIVVRDQLPSDVSYLSGTLTRDGSKISASDFFGSKGDIISSLAPGKTVTYTFEAIVGPKDTPTTCKDQTLTNTGKMTSPGLPSKTSTADVDEKCAPKPPPPAYSCTSLTASEQSRTGFDFTAKASATNGATITGYVYDFGDGSSHTAKTSAGSNSTPHNYAKPGTYHASVTALIDANGSHQVTSNACKTTVTVVPAPAAACTDLNLTLGENRTVTAKVSYTTSGGAKLKNVAYDFGDNSAIVNSTSTTATHQYAQDGKYTVKATLSFTASEAVAEQHCQASIGIQTPAYSCDAFDVNQGDNRTVTVSEFNKSASGGATFKDAVIDWGDSSAATTTTTALGKTHQYASGGTYTIVATAYFTVNGKTVTAPAGNCSAKVTFTTPPTCKQTPNAPQCQKPCQFNSQIPASSSKCVPPTTPPTPPTIPAATVLPNTGAGNVIGLFAAASIAGGLGYRLFLSRRLARR